ncbi:alpha-amylase family protein [Halosquirtibacter xylanolyticus]|uniref:alpha-amylase family protein n=1 Tax=Halosquirtibacter xylanolyticus TaxID=3374599 RepID=UPI003748D776|nr:alpha-amylase family protein [Prolixibacteraceae bacterium]
MMNPKNLSILFLLGLVFLNCQPHVTKIKEEVPKKVVVYQVFTRLFGNTNTTNKPWGTKEENGVGKYNDFSDKALSELNDLGVTHIWYTGVPHHALVGDYTKYGISMDDPDVVKGRAGSPYAVKDYYNVDPDMAVDPSKRLDEFQALINRTHKHNMKVIIDIVPNHVARSYHSITKPELDFGAEDDTTIVFDVDNNFYYIPQSHFEVPDPLNGYMPLGGDKAEMLDGKFDEHPAKWTGNGSRSAKPHFYDWYETVKINYGIDPSGKSHFLKLPDGADTLDYKNHYAYWKDKKVPSSWIKFRDIALFWLDRGVDGFRYDMAEMVPVEFWSFMNSSIKMKNPNAFLMAEVYQPKLYRDYINKGKMDYLYDKVALYDTLKHIMQGHGDVRNITSVVEATSDIEHHMLHFLENHDEQRIASPEFAGNAKKGVPAMIVSATLGTSPTMIYFGQEVGEPGNENAGFGNHSRTSIFDYIGVPHHQRWMNNGKFDGGQLSLEEKSLRNFYNKLLNFTINSTALMGQYEDLTRFNDAMGNPYVKSLFIHARWSNEENLLILSNFSEKELLNVKIHIPLSIVKNWEIEDHQVVLKDHLGHEITSTITVESQDAFFIVDIPALDGLILSVE